MNIDHVSYPEAHHQPDPLIPADFDRLEFLYNRYPKYRERTLFTSLDQLLADHASYQDDFDSEELQKEYKEKGLEKFLVQLSWSDLPYRWAAKESIEKAGPLRPNSYVDSFMSQFAHLDYDHKAYFMFPVTDPVRPSFLVLKEVLKKTDNVTPVRNLFPDQETLHYMAVFDKRDMDTVLLAFHLVYSGGLSETPGTFLLYDYPLPWYLSHLQYNNVVLRSPYLPDRLAKYQGNPEFYHNPAKTVYVRRNIGHILEKGYFSDELDFFRNLNQKIMPLFQWWYSDISTYEEKDGFRSDWRLERTKIRTRLTVEGKINPKWTHEVELFKLLKDMYPDTLYQYRPSWLGRQSLDMYIPSLNTGIEYQGLQHSAAVDFFGGQEALDHRRQLDQQKHDLCVVNGVRLIEWPYDLEATKENADTMLKQSTNGQEFSDKSNDNGE